MFGATIGSHVHAWAQKFVSDHDDPTWPPYGGSISGMRVGFEKTIDAPHTLSEAVHRRRAREARRDTPPGRGLRSDSSAAL